ncbi:MAG: ribbon-helix-helix protein, CopG family [Nitrososphaerales archaeon]
MARSITCSLNRDTDNKLELLSQQLNVSKQEVIRRALNQYDPSENKPVPDDADKELFDEDIEDPAEDEGDEITFED